MLALAGVHQLQAASPALAVGPPTSSFSSVGFTSGSLGQASQWPQKGAPLTRKPQKVKEAF